MTKSEIIDQYTTVIGENNYKQFFLVYAVDCNKRDGRFLQGVDKNYPRLHTVSYQKTQF